LGGDPGNKGKIIPPPVICGGLGWVIEKKEDQNNPSF